MKIVIDAQPIVESRSGIGRYTYNLIKALATQDSNNQYIPFFFNFRHKDFGQKEFLSSSSIKSCEISYLPGFFMHKLWSYCSCLPLDSFTGKADIIHYPNYLIKPSKSGKKIITVCDMSFRRFPETLMPKNLLNLRKNFEKSLDIVDAVITISEFSKSEFLNYYPDFNKPIFVTKMGIDDFLKKNNSKSEIESVLSRYHLPQDYILHVGTIEPRKNLLFLLKAFSKLQNDYPDLKLVLVGAKGWLGTQFDKALSQLKLKDNVCFPGFVSDKDLPAIYKGAKLFVFPSRYEGFGIPPLEAMSCGTPVLASNIPVMKEVLEDAAMLFDLNISDDELASKISEILSDKNLRDNLVQKGLKHSAKFTWEQCAISTLEAYKMVEQK